MKKILLFPLAAVLLTACSNDDNSVQYTGEVETGYLSVNLVTNFAGSRAEADDFEQGSNAENQVNKVRFYFFNSTGGAAAVKKQADGTFVNYFDWDASQDNNFGPAEDNNVTNILNAVIVIENPADGSKDKEAHEAASIVAIINPTQEFYTKNTSSIAKSDLIDIVADYRATAQGFVMSNSVYSDGAASPASVIEVSTAGHVYTTPEAAKGDPVTIYVERVLAKIRLKTTLTPANATADEDGYILYNTGGKYTDDQGQEKDIYVKFLNWDLTCAPDKSYLIKNITPTWDADLLSLEEPWNDITRHRSYWANNPDKDRFAYQFSSFNTIAPTEPGVFVTTNNTRYTTENAGEATDTDYNPTKVIIAAQLCNEDGDPLTIADYAFDRYLSLTDLKTKLLSLLYIKYYTEDAQNGTVESGSTKYRQIGLNDIEFVTAGSLDANNMTCYVYVQLTEAAKALPWVTISNGTATTAQATSVDASLLALGTSKIWELGRTYYYFDVEHLGTNSEGEPRTGVVRNHIYDITITKLAGLGSPVYDPGEVIIPNKPTKDDTYIAAEIKVLSWRLVNQNVELEWN